MTRRYLPESVSGVKYIIPIFFAFALFALLGTLIYAENKATNNGLPLVSGAAASDIPRRNMLYAPCPLTKRNLPQFTDDEETHA